MSKIKMTKVMYEAYLAEEEVVLRGIEDATERRNEAVKEGDLSENASFAKAKEDLQNLKMRKAAITEVLNNAEVINASTSNVLDYGSYIRITKCDKNYNPLNQGKLYILDSIERFLCGFIGVKSPLGKKIFGKPQGNFTITVNGQTMYYKVEKLQPTAEVEEEFRSIYPVTMDGIFDV